MQVFVVLLKVCLIGLGLALIAAGLFCGAIGFSEPGSGSMMFGLIGLGSLVVGGLMVYALLRSFKRKQADPLSDLGQPPEQP